MTADDLRTEVNRRMVGISEVWPSINPWTIWDLRFGDWCGYADSFDARLAAEANKNK